jgi:hypothetical protein
VQHLTLVRGASDATGGGAGLSSPMSLGTVLEDVVLGLGIAANTAVYASTFVDVYVPHVRSHFSTTRTWPRFLALTPVVP